MKILITGGLGYIGSTLATYLVENTRHQITLVDKVSPSIHFMRYIWERPSRIRLGNFDICNSDMLAEQVKNHDVIIHLAAMTLDQCKSNPQLGYFTNEYLACTVGLLCNLYGKRMIFSSTCSNYGISKEPVDESSILNPTTPYAHAKVNAEKFLLKNVQNLTVFRFATAFGKGVNYTRFDTLVNMMVMSAINNHRIELYRPDATRPIIHVMDIVRAINCFLISDLRVLNVGFDDLNITKDELAKQIRDVIDCDISINKKNDERDYKVSFKKFNESYNEKHHSLIYGIRELSKVPMIVK